MEKTNKVTYSDEKFVRRVIDSLRLQRKANEKNSHSGEDVEITLVISKNDLKEMTGRERIHEPAMLRLIALFLMEDGCNVSRNNDGGLILKTHTVVRVRTRFKSVSDLFEAAKDLTS